MPRPLSRCLWLTAAALVVLAGCDREEIHTYTAPKPPSTDVRLLGGIFQNGKEMWFFKLVGLKDQISTHSAAFEKFLTSIRFNNDPKNPIDWTLPEGWAWEKTPPGLFWARVYPLGEKRKRPQLTVSRFDVISSVLDNVNRWAKNDVGTPQLTQKDLKEPIARKIKTAGGHEGYLIDMTGPGPIAGGGSGHPPMMAGNDNEQPRQPAKGNQPFTHITPEGWVENPRQGGAFAAVKTFTVREGAGTAVLKVTTLGGFGELIANINRWRGEVGLPPVQQVEPKPTSINLAGEAADFYDFVGPKQRSLLVVAKRNGGTWFFKLIGDADVVTKNSEKFNSFIRSIKFTGAADE